MVGRLPVTCLLFGPEEELADVRFQDLVTPIGQEGIRLLFFLTTAVRWQLRGGPVVRNPSVYSHKTRM